MKFRQPITPNTPSPQVTNSALPGAGLPSALNYYADFGGCGLWRMLWPASMINAYSKGVINNLTVMLPIPQMYADVKSVRIQRQATTDQKKFAEFLSACRDKHKFKMIYEVDDIVLYEDIPAYNMCRKGFADPEIRKTIKSIIDMCDVFTVVSPYMKSYYSSKLDIAADKIKVIPNYAPKYWIDRFYDADRRMKLYDINKKRPRVGFCGSGTHFDVATNTNYQDDFTHVAQYVIATLDKYKWVFLGGVPPVLKQYVASGQIEVTGWQPIYQYPYAMDALNLNAVVAPLADNPFNRAKANIKITEAGAYGLPGVFQNLDCYAADAPFLFDTGAEMIDQLQSILSDETQYSHSSKQARAIADKFWLDDHLSEYTDLYFGPK